MRKKLTLTVDPVTAAFLARHAADESGGNVSAYVDRHFSDLAMAEAARAEARWYADNPDYLDAEEAENAAMTAELHRGPTA